MTGAEYAPARLSSRIAIGCSALALLSVGVWYRPGLLLGAGGLVCVAAGVYRGSRTLLGAALGCVTVASVSATVAGAPVEAALVALVAGVVAWDAGLRAITLGEQLGRAATTTRLEVTHAAASGLVGVGSVGVTYLLFDRVSVSYPLVSVVAFAGGVVVLLFARRPHPRR